jgi:hypothetical protein
MNEHEASIALALIEAGNPRCALIALLVLKLPWRTISIGTLAAQGPSFRWGDVVRWLLP